MKTSNNIGLLEPYLKLKKLELCKALKIKEENCFVVTKENHVAFRLFSEKCIKDGGLIKLAFSSRKGEVEDLSMIYGDDYFILDHNLIQHLAASPVLVILKNILECRKVIKIGENSWMLHVIMYI